MIMNGTAKATNFDMMALVWSQRDNLVKIEKLSDVLTENRRACLADEPGDLRVVAVGTTESLLEVVKSLTPVLVRRGVVGPPITADDVIRKAIESSRGAA